MNCQEIQSELSAYIDGELPAELRAQIDAHLGSCPKCQKQIAELKKLAAGVSALPKPEPSPEFLTEVRRKIARGEEAENIPWQDVFFRSSWLKAALGAAALIAVCVLVSDLTRPLWRRPVTTLAKVEEPPANEAKPAAPESQAFRSASDEPARERPAAAPAGEAPKNVEQAKAEAVERSASAVESRPATSGEQSPKSTSGSYLSEAQPLAAAPALTSTADKKEASKLAQVPQVVPGLVRLEETATERGTTGSGQLADGRLITGSDALTTSNNATFFRVTGKPSEVIVTEADDAAEVETRVDSLLVSLHGKIVAQDSTKPGLRKIYISLPAKDVEAFKAQFAVTALTKQRRDEAGGQTNAAPAQSDRKTAVAMQTNRQTVVDQVHAIGTLGGAESTLSNAPPMTVLEIQVVPPKNQ